MLRMVLVVAAVLGASIATASAQGGGMLGRMMDLKPDGAITKAEARTARAAEFRAADTNYNDILEATERAAAHTQALQLKQGTP